MSQVIYSNIARQQQDAVDGKGYPKADGGLACGSVQVAQVAVEMPGTAFAAGDSIAIVRLPAGAIVIPELSSVTSEGIGTLGVSVGTAAATSAYMASTAVGGAGNYPMKNGTLAGKREPLATGTMVQATVTTAGTPTAGKRLVFVVAFTAR